MGHHEKIGQRMKYGKILLTGGAGRLGRAILSSGFSGSLLSPPRRVLDITMPETIVRFFGKNDFDAVIHCAAVAKTADCEKDPGQAIRVNVIGTANLAIEVMKKEAGLKKKIRFVYISTDGVYPGTAGNYSELSGAMPYNRYGWTKLGGECAVNLLPDRCIIRTSFFDPLDIPFDDSATDSYSSKMTVDRLARAVLMLLDSGFIGTVNVGREKISDYELYKEYKPILKPVTLQKMLKRIPFDKAKDLSLDIKIWKEIEGRFK